MIPDSARPLLHHADPIVFVDRILAFDGRELVCESSRGGAWSWAELLEGSAQCAGVLVGLAEGGVPKDGVAAEFRDVVVHAQDHDGPVRFRARRGPRFLNFWRCATQVTEPGGRLLLEAEITLAERHAGLAADDPADAGALLRRVVPRPAGLDLLLAEHGLGDLFDGRQHEAAELVELYVLQAAADVVREAGLDPGEAEGAAPAALLAAAGIPPAAAEPFAWLLELLASHGCLQRRPDGRLRRARPLPSVPRAELRARLAAVDARCAPNLDFIDLAATAYGRVRRGASPEQALLGRLDTWLAYFSNANPIYALCNRVAARLVRERLAPGARILELGAGAGSATEAVLEALDDAGRLDELARYHVTEIVAPFRQRAERLLRARWPRAPLSFGPLDLNGDWSAASGPWDLVVAVNVFHLARDVRAALARVRAALAPGGWLVLGECVRPRAGQPVGMELCVQLLPSYRAVLLDELRPAPGFLTPEQWTACLRAGGLQRVELRPDLARVRELHPRFFVGAVAGQAPEGSGPCPPSAS